jgi:transcription initiation factor TFIID subunit 12
MEIADEFIDSVTNFGCRLAKHRGAETLEVRDLQLHLGALCLSQSLLVALKSTLPLSTERNHDIRIPGFASDETRFAASQTGAAAGAGAKKAGGGTGMTLRSQRLQQVQQAKRDGKLL